MNRDFGVRSLLATAVAAGLLFMAAVPAWAQQTGTIQGRIIDQSTQRPLAGATVSVPGTPHGTLTQANGRFQLLNVPAGQHTVQAQMIGYADAERTITVVAGEVVTADFALEPTAIALREVVVTGVAEATPRAKLPFTVDQLRAADLPVPAASAASAIQGKVPGALVVQGSGRPGEPPSILLRGPTSIHAGGRSQEPLYIVDGVIVGAQLVDIDALDIENIEIIKGAAASSMYGSRAANGVINITTRRGEALTDDQVRYSVRSEYGRSSLDGRFNLTQAHQFLMQDGQFVAADGSLCAPFPACPSVTLAGQMRRQTGVDEDGNPTFEPRGSWNTIQREAWPQTFDQIGRFFDPGDFMQNYVSAEGRSGRTNFHVSMSNLREQGVIMGQSGRNRTNFRANLDQSVRDNVTVSASAFYSTSTSDQFDAEEFGFGQGNPLFRLTRMPAGVNLAGCVDDLDADCTGPGDRLERLIVNPDPFNENDNALYELLNRRFDEGRGRFLGSANVRYNPFEFLSLDANVSYDRLDRNLEDYWPKGFRTVRATPTVNQGSLWRLHDMIDALNASLTATFRYMVGELTTRTQFRYLLERNDWERSTVSGYRFGAIDVPSIGNTDPDTRTGSSLFRREIAEGIFALTNMDFRDRYILDLMVRQDGSSMFGPEERRNWYGRAAAAWRLSEEPWFNVDGIDEFKLRYSVGTAGNRPSWPAQYETFSVAGGVITPVTLGNRFLKPEFSTEHEVGLDMIAFDRFTLGLTYADVTTRDQILPVPMPSYVGFGTQWLNAGTLSSNTWEASLEARLIETPDFFWSSRLLFDRTRQTITEMNMPAFVYGVPGQQLGDVFYAREGERLGTFYGVQFAESCADLPQNFTAAPCEEFRVNDDGFLVWVGAAGDWRAGWEDRGDGRNWWGTASGFNIGGRPVMWGNPIVGHRIDPMTGEETTFLPVGNTLPDYTISFANTLSWRGVSLYGLLDAVQGVDVYNQPLQWATFQNYSGIMDQSGQPQELQKPLGYYAEMYGLSGLGPSSRFVEDASFVKLRELALSYRFGAPQLAAIGLRGVSGATLSVIGRNLFTWTDYDGYDPEVGRGGGTTGSAALARVDGYNYPNFRTFTFGVQVDF